MITANDDCAVGLIDSLLRAHVDVPADMSVVGYDDSSLARLPFVNLTTVRQDVAQLAKLAVEAVLERLETGRSEAKTVTLAERGLQACARRARIGSVDSLPWRW